MSSTPSAPDRPIRQALKRVAVTLKAEGVPFALAGSYASWARGGPETDHDADFLVRPQDVERACSALAAVGMRIERPPEDWLAKAFDDSTQPPAMVDIIHATNQIDVDCDTLGCATEVEVDSVVMPVVSATDFLRLRLLALNEHACDFTTLLPHARALREQIDWPGVRAAIRGHPFAEAFFTLTDGLKVTTEEARP